MTAQEQTTESPALEYAEGRLIQIVESCGRVTEYIYDQPELAGARL